MQHRQVDVLMKDIEQHYKGDFLINGELEFSKQMANEIRKKEKNRFYGSNGLFSPEKMFGTDGCKITADFIEVPQSGAVYGPYFTFPAGAYSAKFRVEQAQNVTVSVCSQKLGVVATQKVSAPQSDIIPLDFSLPDTTEQLEFKVENHDGAPIIFRYVEIVPDNLQTLSTEVSAPEISTSFTDELSDALTIKRQCDWKRKELAQKAECELPAHTRLRCIKLLLRRLMQPFTLMQMAFNRSVVALFHNIQEQITLLLNGMVKFNQQQQTNAAFLEEKWNEYVVQREILVHENADLRLKQQQFRQQNDIMTERLNALIATFERQNADISAVQMQNAELTEKLEVLTTVIKQQDSILSTSQQQNAMLSNNITVLSEKLVQIQDVSKQDLDARQEIANLWDKIREYDINFRDIWKSEGDINANLGNVWSTYSTFRQEIFYELDARTQTAGSPQSLHIDAKIKDSAREKIQAAGGLIRLNLGSGNLSVDGYLNTDARDLSQVDIVADVAALPFEAETVDEIYSAHLIEHFTRSRMEKELLPYWYSLLKPGGLFQVVFPDLEAMIASYNASEMSFEQMGNIIMGGQDYMLDYHYAVYSPETVTKMLEKAGFCNIRILAQGRENGGCKETEIIAVK